jgi:hypothetical protein
MLQRVEMDKRVRLLDQLAAGPAAGPRLMTRPSSIS